MAAGIRRASRFASNTWLDSASISRPDLLQFVGQPVDDRIEQPEQGRRRVADQPGSRPTWAMNARIGLGVT